jgi:integrase
MATGVFKLTQRTVASAICPPDRKDRLMFDGELAGFGLRVTAAGSRTFLAQYSTPTGKRRVPLGAFGVITVDEARRKAKSVLGMAADGRDPFTERKMAAVAMRKAKTEAEYTFGILVDAWAKARVGDRRPSYLREAVACLRRNLPTWLNRAATSITVVEAVRAVDRIKADKGTVAANRTLSYARAAFGWAMKRQHVATNPLKGIERAGREAPRERVLSETELGEVWRACDALGATAAGFVRTLMLTLQRREEVASMRWGELDDPADPTVWTLPAERAKNARTHVIHLSDPVRAIIRSMPRIQGIQFVFATQKNRSVGGFSRIKDIISGALLEAGILVDDWRFHDFRRAGVTALAGMGFAPHVCDRILNHVTGSIQGIAAVYQRAEFLAERKAALDAWAAYVLRAAGKGVDAENVMKLRRAG